jgi:hypothetical protein
MILYSIENLVLRARSECNGFAGKDCELFWSTGVPESMKSQTPSTKQQTNLKFQYQMTKTGLEFLVTTADCLKWVKTIEAPQGAAQSRILYLIKRIEYEATISPGNAQALPLWPQPRFLVRRRGRGLLLGLQQKISRLSLFQPSGPYSLQ